MKKCARCNQIKTESEFCKNKRCKDGLHFYCRECNAERSSQYQKKNPDRKLKWAKEFYARNKENLVIKCQEWHRIAILNYGAKCKRCGFKDWRALQFDHINGISEKSRSSITYWKKVIAQRDNGVYQLLCANCNWIKRYENKEHSWREDDKSI